MLEESYVLHKIKAYKISSNHFIKNNFFVNNDFKKAQKNYIELEWLSGFIALNFQNKPKLQ